VRRHFPHSGTSIVFIGIGSNIDAEQNLHRASELLQRQWPKIRFSAVFRSSPQEIVNQPFYLNAVACAESADTPEQILSILRESEELLKKAQPYRFGPRTIDLDLLLIDSLILKTPALTIPHPRMQRRRFVLEPLCELINPEAQHPALKEPWSKLLLQTKHQDCERTEIVL